MSTSLKVLAVVVSLVFVQPAVSAVTFPRPANGQVVEVCLHRLCEFTVWVTDAAGGIIPAVLYPQTKLGERDQQVTFGIGKRVQTGPNPGDDEAVFDVFQRTKIIQNSGEVNTLKIEAMLFDPTSASFVLSNVFGALGEAVGFGVEVRIPDLFADTSGDGVLGDGDVLHSLVDLTVFLAALPTFVAGQAFDVVDGIVPGLPGMMFSTTEFEFDPATGFSGTPFTGRATTEAFHGITALATPQSWSLALLALAVAGGLGRRLPPDDRL